LLALASVQPAHAGETLKHLHVEKVGAAPSKTVQRCKTYRFRVADGSGLVFEVKGNTKAKPDGAACAKGGVAVAAAGWIGKVQGINLVPNFEMPKCQDCHATLNPSQYDIEIVIDPNRKTWP